MATAELTSQKARLIGRIGRTHNVAVLHEVERFLDEKLPEDVYELTPEEEAILDEAERDTVLISNEDFQREIQEWFKSRR